jgi:hypothetical protein
MAKNNLKDSEAKAVLRGWPQRTKSLWPTNRYGGYWLRALPKDGTSACPHLQSPGAKLFKTQPDGLFLFISEGAFADAVSVEVCGTIPNLNDKRSRDMPSSHSVVVSCPQQWLREEIKVQKGGLVKKWKACNSISNHPQGDLTIPIRYLRVLYAIPNAKFEEWCRNHTPTGFEYFCKHSSLDSFKSQTMQGFLRQMSIHSHFLGKVT